MAYFGRALVDLVCNSLCFFGLCLESSGESAFLCSEVDC